MIITGNLDNLIKGYKGNFCTLTTDDIFCEQTTDGYNSSVMIFPVRLDQDNGTAVAQVQVLYDTLAKYYKWLLKYLMRFDHYLEMLVWNADIL